MLDKKFFSESDGKLSSTHNKVLPVSLTCTFLFKVVVASLPPLALLKKINHESGEETKIKGNIFRVNAATFVVIDIH